MSLADYIQNHLKKNKVTLYSVSKKSGITYGYLDRVSKGFKGNLTQKTQEKLAFGLGVDISEISQAMARRPKPSEESTSSQIEIPVLNLSDVIGRLPISGETLAQVSTEYKITLPSANRRWVGLLIDLPLNGYSSQDLVVINPGMIAQEGSKILFWNGSEIFLANLYESGRKYHLINHKEEVVAEIGKHALLSGTIGVVHWICKRI